MKYCRKYVCLRSSSSEFKGLWYMSIGDYTSIPKGSVFIVLKRLLLSVRK